MMTTNKPQIAVHHRWMIKRDMPEVLGIEAANFDYPWPEEDFIRVLRQRNCIGRVAEHKERIVGFNIYEIHKNRLHILNIAVHAAMQRRGVGTQMVENLKTKLSRDRRNRIMLEIRETNLAAQLFFRAQGFRCISVLREFYNDVKDDAFLFQYRMA